MDYRLSLTTQGFLALYVSSAEREGRFDLVSIYPNANSIGWHDNDSNEDSFVINLGDFHDKPSNPDQ